MLAIRTAGHGRLCEFDIWMKERNKDALSPINDGNGSCIMSLPILPRLDATVAGE
jgi:hypothetical protein